MTAWNNAGPSKSHGNIKVRFATSRLRTSRSCSHRGDFAQAPNLELVFPGTAAESGRRAGLSATNRSMRWTSTANTAIETACLTRGGQTPEDQETPADG